MMKQLSNLLALVGTLLRKPIFWIVLYVLGSTYWMISQQMEIDALKERIDTEHTMEHSDTFTIAYQPRKHQQLPWRSPERTRT